MKSTKWIGMLFTMCVFLTSCSTAQTSNETEITNEFDGDKVVKTDQEWRDLLTPEEYDILREQGTERSFTGEFYNHHEDGTYTCKGCGLDLFDSETKFVSGTGWPSYYEPINGNNVGHIADNSGGWSRTEVVCNRCDGHLGHVFNDGPKPTGLRYCINSASLSFKIREVE